MSFFGFDSSLPRDRPHNAGAPGFGPTPDPFAGLSKRNVEDDDGALDFEDTYDGLGNDLEEDRDTFNDDTFGVGNVGTDFDFSGQGVQPQPKPPQNTPFLSGLGQSAISRPTQPSKPARTGYERYGKGAIPSLEANAGIWGPQIQSSSSASPAPTQPHQSSASVSKKMMSLDEVEASLRANKKPSPAPPLPSSQDTPPNATLSTRPSEPTPPRRMEVPPGLPDTGIDPYHFAHSANVTSQQLSSDRSLLKNSTTTAQHIAGPRQILQNPNSSHQPGHTPLQSQEIQTSHHAKKLPHHSRGPSLGGQIVTHPSQLTQLPKEERAALLAEDAKRAKRNHKIHLLSRDNGLMTPQDKNFITRIQLQQLVTATGGADEKGPDAGLAEDFYYVVLSQIRGAASNQPSNHFAQTYLNQLAWRGGNRRNPRGGGGENHMRRMEQQVQRAVEAAKARPLNRQLVMEGSLGKISFSNAKTPKPLLNLKRHDSYDAQAQRGKVRASTTAAGRKTTLKDIEAVYATLMNMEDHERRMPPPPTEESSGDEIQGHMNWRTRIQELHRQLWDELKVLEPISPNSSSSHPFIAILSFPKGKKLVPRVFRQIDDQQRLTILTIIVIHLDALDVVRLAAPRTRDVGTQRALRDDIELFTQAVMPSLFAYVSDAHLNIIVGLVGLVVDRVNVQMTVRTRVGLGFLTTFISRAELIKQSGHAEQQDVEQWTTLYNKLFDALEPQLPFLFPEQNESSDDIYVWQFLAALGIGANTEQQQRLVIGVKDKVMSTVTEANAMPEEIGRPRLDNVNLFMKAIGLDVGLLG